MATITAAHIAIDENGVAWIDDTKVKVVEVVTDKIAHGSSPEEMHFQYPHLSLAQIHAALAYYYDNQSALDAEIDRRWQEAEAVKQKISDSPLRRRLLGLKGSQRAEASAVIYRRRKGSDTWHRCRNCSSWPRENYEEITSLPTTGEHCNECQSKQSAGSCNQ